MTSLKAIKKGEKVALLGFTGILLGMVEVAESSKTEIKVNKRDGDVMVFSKDTGIQTNVVEGKEKYANKIVHSDDTPEQKAKTPKTPKAPKEVVEKKENKKADKKAKKVEKAPEVDEDDDFEDTDAEDDGYEEV